MTQYNEARLHRYIENYMTRHAPLSVEVLEIEDIDVIDHEIHVTADMRADVAFTLRNVRLTDVLSSDTFLNEPELFEDVLPHFTTHDKRCDIYFEAEATTGQMTDPFVFDLETETFLPPEKTSDDFWLQYMFLGMTIHVDGASYDVDYTLNPDERTTVEEMITLSDFETDPTFPARETGFDRATVITA